MENNTNNEQKFTVGNISIPSEYIHTLENKMKKKDAYGNESYEVVKSYFIKLGGLLYIANKMGTLRVKTREIPNDNEIVYECEAFIIPNKEYIDFMGIDINTALGTTLVERLMTPVIMHGTCNSTNSQLYTKYARHMAETRSIARTLRVLTGCSMTAVEEMDKSDLSGNMEESGKANKSKPTMNTLAEMDLFSMGDNPDRKAMINVVYQLLDKQPYRGEMQVICKRNKANVLNPQEMTDDCLREIYDKCRARMNA